MKDETIIQRDVMLALSQNNCMVFRANVGKFLTMDGRYIKIGIKGHSDLYGHTIPEGKAFYIETKTPEGKASAEQKKFIQAMKASGALAGFAKSAEEALKIVKIKTS